MHFPLSLLLLSSLALAHLGPSRINRHGLGMEKRVASLVRKNLERKGLIGIERDSVVPRGRGTGKGKLRKRGKCGKKKVGAQSTTTTTSQSAATTTTQAQAKAEEATGVVANVVGGRASETASFDTTSTTSAGGRHGHGHATATTTTVATTPLVTSTTTTSVKSVSSSGSGSGSSGGGGGCFPLSAKTFPANGAPSASRDEWWCGQEKLYGFLGFSYPMEITDCSDYTNSYEAISTDMKKMKSEFGATMLRVYAPQCRSVSVWENLVKAGADNGMAVIVMVWWGFQADQNAWKQTQSSLYELFTSSSVSSLAPYVIHSASFGSEPIGDGVDGGNFISDLAAFRSKMNSFGIPVGISEDWDRWGVMSAQDGLGDMGRQVKENTDITHAHIMPYYHPTEVVTASDAWSYVQKQVEWLNANVGQAVMITESMWASFAGSHGRGMYDNALSTNTYATYWNAFADNCAFFKQQKAGWFVHTWSDSQEPGFGMIDSSGNSKIPGWYPQRC